MADAEGGDLHVPAILIAIQMIMITIVVMEMIMIIMTMAMIIKGYLADSDRGFLTREL